MSLARTVRLGLVWIITQVCCHQYGWQITGTVEEASALEQPARVITGAQVHVECPGLALHADTQTNDRGDFALYGRNGRLSYRCSLVVKKTGYVSARVSLETVCIDPRLGEGWLERHRARVCGTAMARVALTPQTHTEP